MFSSLNTNLGRKYLAVFDVYADAEPQWLRRQQPQQVWMHQEAANKTMWPHWRRVLKAPLHTANTFLL